MTPSPGQGRPTLSSRIATIVISVAAVTVCVLMASWQWDRAHRTAADAVPTGEVVALADLDPTTAFSGMRVQVSGHFDQQRTVLVGPRLFGAVPGAWVLTPLLPDDGGAAVAVVRGWIPTGASPADPPEGAVGLLTVLVADQQRSIAGAAEPLTDAGMIPAVDTGALAAQAGYPVRSGWFAVLDPAASGSGGPPATLTAGSGTAVPLPLEVADLPGADLGMNWRNAAYALQWLVFAGFVVLFARGLTRAHPGRVEQTQETTR